MTGCGVVFVYLGLLWLICVWGLVCIALDWECCGVVTLVFGVWCFAWLLRFTGSEVEVILIIIFISYYIHNKTEIKNKKI